MITPLHSVRASASKSRIARLLQCEPIFSKILSLYAEQNDLKFAVPGGLIGVGTRVDPTLTRADRLVGQVLGLKGNLPDVFTEVINWRVHKVGGGGEGGEE